MDVVLKVRNGKKNVQKCHINSLAQLELVCVVRDCLMFFIYIIF